MTKQSEIAVTKIVLNLKGKPVELTVEEARKLRAELEGLLGNVPYYTPFPQIIYVDRYVTPQPAYPTWNPAPNYFPQITCQANDSGRFHTTGFMQVTN